MNVVLGSISGSIIGFVVASIVRPPYPFFKFSIIQIGIGEPLHFRNPDMLIILSAAWAVKCICKSQKQTCILNSSLFIFLLVSMLFRPWFVTVKCILPCREYWECATCLDCSSM